MKAADVSQSLLSPLLLAHLLAHLLLGSAHAQCPSDWNTITTGDGSLELTALAFQDAFELTDQPAPDPELAFDLSNTQFILTMSTLKMVGDFNPSPVNLAQFQIQVQEVTSAQLLLFDGSGTELLSQPSIAVTGSLTTFSSISFTLPSGGVSNVASFRLILTPDDITVFIRVAPIIGCTPPDPGWCEWGTWSACSSSCDQGESERLRNCSCEPPQTDYQDCVGEGRETKICAGPGPVDCKWSQWTLWEDCSVTCGGGTKTVRREVVTEASCGGECTGDTERHDPCNSQCCPAYMGAWTSWTDCNASCGPGIRARARSCVASAPSCPAEGCIGDLNDEEECEDRPCETDTQPPPVDITTQDSPTTQAKVATPSYRGSVWPCFCRIRGDPIIEKCDGSIEALDASYLGETLIFQNNCGPDLVKVYIYTEKLQNGMIMPTSVIIQVNGGQKWTVDSGGITPAPPIPGTTDSVMGDMQNVSFNACDLTVSYGKVGNFVKINVVTSGAMLDVDGMCVKK